MKPMHRDDASASGRSDRGRTTLEAASAWDTAWTDVLLPAPGAAG